MGIQLLLTILFWPRWTGFSLHIRSNIDDNYKTIAEGNCNGRNVSTK